MSYLCLKTLNQDGHEQIEEHVVSERHKSYKVESGAGRSGRHAIVQHHVPVLLGENLQQTYAQSETGDTQKTGTDTHLHKKSVCAVISACVSELFLPEKR